MVKMAFEDNQMDPSVTDALQSDSRSARKAAQAGLGLLMAAALIAAMWVGAVSVGAALTLGIERLMSLSRLEMAGLAFAALLPAFLVLFCGMAAREGARARAEGRRLADAADRMINPSPGAQVAANRVGHAVRQEISALDRALDGVLLKLRETEQHVARQSSVVANTAESARLGAQHMISGMERERDALVQIASDLNAQAKLIGDQISRHVRVLSDAARLAETEVRAADAQLDQRLGSFTAATNLIGDRTHALHTAAQATSDSSLRLESALSNALDVLAKATSLTDAARQNAEQASRAADNTATAVRDTTGRAIDEAKHAADLIRTEAAAMERDAARAIERLREAATVARAASDDLRAASGAAVSANLQARHVPAPPPEGPQRPRGDDTRTAPSRTAGRFLPVEELDTAWNALERDSSAATPAPSTVPTGDGSTRPTASAAPNNAPAINAKRRPTFAEQLTGAGFSRGAPPPQAANANPAPTTPSKPERKADRANTGGGWRWRDMLAAIDREDRRAGDSAPTGRNGAAARRTDTIVAAAPNTFDATASMDKAGGSDLQAGVSARGQGHMSVLGFARHPLPIVGVMETAGLTLSAVFSPTSLDRIAQRARNGTQARRRAVREAAPDAVVRLEAALRQDSAARAEAGAFLRSEGARIAELLGRGRAAMTADATRAFLLLDAASA